MKTDPQRSPDAKQPQARKTFRTPELRPIGDLSTLTADVIYSFSS